MLQTVYINPLVALNPFKCPVEWDDLSHMNEYTEDCTATVTHFENESAENRAQSADLRAYLLFQLQHILFYNILKGWN